MSNEVREHTGGKLPITTRQRESFLLSLYATPHVGKACEVSGISRAAAYRLRASDPRFRECWDEALEGLPSRVLDAYLEDGLIGRPVLDGAGNVVGHQREPSILRDLGRKYLGIPSGGNVNVAVGVQNNMPDASKDFEAARVEWQRRRKALEQRDDVIDAQVIPDDDDVSDLLEE